SIRNHFRAWVAVEKGQRYYPYHLYIRKCEIMVVLGLWTEAEEIYRRNLATVGPAGYSDLSADSKMLLGKLLINRGAFDEASTLLDQALHYYRGQGKAKEAGLVLIGLGDTYWRRGLAEQAKDAYVQQLEMARSLHDANGIYLALGNLGILYHNTGDDGKAMDCYLQVEKLAAEEGNLRAQYIVAGNIGNIYLRKRDYPAATSYYQNQLAKAKAAGDKLVISHAIGNLAIVDAETGDIHSALKHYGEQLAIARALGDRVGISRVLGNMSMDYAELGQEDLARDHMSQSLALAREIGYKPIIGVMAGELGALYKRASDFSSAEKCYLEAIPLAREMNLGHQLLEVLHGLAELYCLMNHAGAAASIREARQAAEAQHQPDIIVACDVLQAKIISRTDRAGAVQQLTALLGNSSGDQSKALLQYELFRLTGNEAHRVEALRRYRSMFVKMPKRELWLRIQELEGN
ncbi:MAG: tetratricopeptide repeat protein, partial [Candidatus Edwardsbacteria bacterium]|nr:tetratricopeptide repeat protein [Candidatus Edwardsbacteria bacterium]